MISKRLLWVDSVKVIGILLVVIGHMQIPQHMMLFIAAFHMPLFFFISGYLEKYKNIKDTILIGIKTLIIPYIILYGIAYIHWLILFLQHPEAYNGQSMILTLSKPAMGLFLGIGRDTSYSIMLNVILWFLPALFFVKIIHSIILKISTRYFDCYPVFIGITVCIMFLMKFSHKTILFSIDSAFLAFPFFALGYLFNKYNIINLISKFPMLFQCIISIMGYIFIVFAVIFNGMADINYFSHGRDCLLFYVLGMIGVLSTICISLFLYRKELKLLTIISSGTMFIMAFHVFLNEQLYKILDILNLEYEQNIAITISIAILNIGLMSVPIVIVKKYFPIMIGK